MPVPGFRWVRLRGTVTSSRDIVSGLVVILGGQCDTPIAIGYMATLSNGGKQPSGKVARPALIFYGPEKVI